MWRSTHSCVCAARVVPRVCVCATDSRLKLADFGLSRIVAAEKPSPLRAAASASTSALPPPEDDAQRDPSIVGTPFYMAPEIIRGKARGIEVASEWWSVGIILYELLLGFPPFQGAKVRYERQRTPRAMHTCMGRPWPSRASLAHSVLSTC